MDIASTYIPIDRRHALVNETELPERTEGATLFADISGFTPLTTALTRELGPRRGAEELTNHLNLVFDALILELHRYGGSVIGFCGDAITCWMDGDDGRRAVACGLAMQRVMAQFAEVKTQSGNVIALAIKVAVTVGPVRRFLIGDPEFTVMDTMVGRTLERMAEAEGLADRGEVVVDAAVVDSLGDGVKVVEWRSIPPVPELAEGAGDGQEVDRYAVVSGLTLDVPESPWAELADDALTETQKQAWIQPPIYQRMRTGRGEFLAELRPVVPLFVRFDGIDYEADPDAPQKLDRFLRQIEAILARYDASLMHLTIGDKGSYLQAAFGTPIAHEDDEARAAAAALAIMEAASQLDYLTDIQIGIAQGQMRTGSYGGTTRRTYGMMGDDVILAARLMSAAGSGQILVSEVVYRAINERFRVQLLAPIRVKGRTDAVGLARLMGPIDQHQIKLLEPQYALPMVGRAAEQALINRKLDLAAKGKGQIVGISAEAGMGKSRLAAEVIAHAQTAGFAPYGGECQSYGTNSSYLVWQNIWRGFFGLDPAQPQAEQIAAIEQQLQQMEPMLVPRLPLLGTLLNLLIPETDLTRSFDPKLRKTSLESMLIDCLRYRVNQSAGQGPIILVLEDCHWLDPLSHDLIEVIGRAIANLPVFMLLVYRPPDQTRIQAPRVGELPYFTEVPLTDFTDAEAEQLITLKLQQFFGPESNVSTQFVTMVTQRAAGNPFYMEEILNYLQDMGIDPHDPEQLAAVDLPTSIYSLILSRIDQLNEQQQITLRVASVIGRLFRAAMIWGVYPELGEPGRVRADLELLSNLELTPLDTPHPELAYLFKHIMTQEVAYESLPFATRGLFHQQIGHYIEATYSDHLDQYRDLLAFHFDNSPNVEKKRHYLRLAGEAAQADYANTAAINYFERLLPHLHVHEQGEIHYQLGLVLDTVGSYDEADAHFHAALSLAQEQSNRVLDAQCRIAIGELLRKQANYDDASDWFIEAQTISEQINDQSGVAKALICAGSLALYLGDFADAQRFYDDSLAIRRALGDRPNEANTLNNLAITAANQGDLMSATERFAESMTIRQSLDDRWGVANSLTNLGQLAQLQKKYTEAHSHLATAITSLREIGDRWLLGNALLNQANVLRGLSRYDEAAAHYEESLFINQDLGDQWMLAYLLEDMGGLLSLQGEGERPLKLAGAASSIRKTLGTPLTGQEKEVLDTVLADARNSLGVEAATAAWSQGQTLSTEEALGLVIG